MKTLVAIMLAAVSTLSLASFGPVAAFTLCGATPGTAPSGEYLDESAWDVSDYDQASDCLEFNRDWEGPLPSDGPVTQSAGGIYTQSGICSYFHPTETDDWWQPGSTYDTLGHCVGVGVDDPDLPTSLNLVRRYDTRMVRSVGAQELWWADAFWCRAPIGDTDCDNAQLREWSGVSCPSQTVTACDSGGPDFRLTTASGDNFCIMGKLMRQPAFGGESVFDETDFVCWQHG